jgi:hypothetical protein
MEVNDDDANIRGVTTTTRLRDATISPATPHQNLALNRSVDRVFQEEHNIELCPCTQRGQGIMGATGVGTESLGGLGGQGGSQIGLRHMSYKAWQNATEEARYYYPLVFLCSMTWSQAGRTIELTASEYLIALTLSSG